MRLRDMTEQTAYVVARGYPQGKGIFQGAAPRTGYARMRFPDGEWDGEAFIPLGNISREWDHPEEVAKRARIAAHEARREQARKLLEVLGFTVGRPGEFRSRAEPQHQAHVQSTYSGAQVTIDVDAFLAMFNVPNLDEVAAELHRLRRQHRTDRAKARA